MEWVTSTIALQEIVQNPTIRRKTDAYSVLGLTRPSTGTLSGEWHNNKQWDAYGQAEACNSKQKPRTPVERCCVVARQCPSTLLKHSGNSSLKCWLIPRIVLILPRLTPLVWSTQRGIEGPSIHLGPRSEESGAECCALLLKASVPRRVVKAHQNGCFLAQYDALYSWL